MKLSARNQIPGTITSVTRGQTTGHVHIDIGNGVTVHASITNEAIDLKVGDKALAGNQVVRRHGGQVGPAPMRRTGSRTDGPDMKLAKQG